MKKLVLTLLAAAALLSTAIPAHAASPELDKVLRQLDVASAKFTSAQADVKQDQYTKVVDDTAVTIGTVYFKRSGTTQMAAHYRTVNGQPSGRTVVYDGITLQLYEPGNHQITRFAAGKNKNQYESFLTLGFGGSGRALEASWDIKLVGTEKLNDGTRSVSVVHLDLTSKDPNVNNMFSKISIWVDPSRDVSLKQVFDQSSGDSYTAYYSNIKTNVDIPDKIFKLDAKALGAQVIQR